MSLARTASVITIGGFRPSGHPLASHFGLTPVALPDEDWPRMDGRPLRCLCQLNLIEAPAVPEILRDIALLTLFMDMESRHLGNENGEGWLIRTYTTFDGLRPLQIPREWSQQRGFEVKYSLVEDVPSGWDDDYLPKELEFASVDPDQNVFRTKIGGYGSYLQSEPWWIDFDESGQIVPAHPSAPRYAFQLATEEKVSLYWGDSGAFVLGRGTAPGHSERWFADLQCSY